MVAKTSAYGLLLALMACAPAVWGAAAPREPHVGYVYPAGGRRGSTFEVTVGGQFLRGVTDVYVSGSGVHAKLVEYYHPPRNLMPDQRRELQRRLYELREKRLAELKQQGREPQIPDYVLNSWQPRTPPGEVEGVPAGSQPIELPGHPLLRNLESKDLKALQYVTNQLLDWRTLQKRQLNTQLSDMVVVEVTIDPDAKVGDRELRLGTPLGLTNPLCFQVGVWPEVCEQEPNDPVGFEYLPQEPPSDLPVVLNGQIMPGDVDRFRFLAVAGQHLVVETQARHLVPFLADAVPGWFQATVALYDADGKEVAFDDDYRFDPDPVLLYEVPRDGEYTLEVRDAIYRGREDFVYRITVGEVPFITRAFPLGGRAGSALLTTIDGWNLPSRQLRLDTTAGGPRVREDPLQWGDRASNGVTYAVDTLPECTEDESEPVQRVELPVIVNGRIAEAGDEDVFRFEGKAGDEVVAEVLARRLRSPLDSLLRLTDNSGRIVAWNDDHMLVTAGYLHPDMGLLTHQADSYLSIRLPADGAYEVHLTDAQGHGGEEYGYRLRLSAPRPDFTLRATPSSLGPVLGASVPFTVYALRADGFDGEIEVVPKNLPPRFRLDGGRIPAGRDHVRMTLMAPRQDPPAPFDLQLEGRAQIGGKTVVRPVLPADDTMQAFLYRHLVPAQEMLVAVREVQWPRPAVSVMGDLPLRVPANGTAVVHFQRRNNRLLRKIEVVPLDPPPGVSVQNPTILADGLAFQLKTAADAPEVGFADNLVVEVFGEFEVATEAKDGAKPGTETRRRSIGLMPAVPYVVVGP